MFYYVCTNSDCSENGATKFSPIVYDVPPICGVCGQPTTTDGVEHPHTPPLSLEDRVAALEEFNASLVSALSSIFNPADPADGSQFAALIDPQAKAKK